MSEFVDLEKNEKVLALATLACRLAGVALGTASGVVKRVLPEYPSNKDSFELIGLKDGDTVVGAVELAGADDDLVFITSDAQLLRFDATGVRPQGRAAGGMAGVRLATGAHVVFFGAVAARRRRSRRHDRGLVGGAARNRCRDGESGRSTPSSRRRAGRPAGCAATDSFAAKTPCLLGWVGPPPAKATASSGVAIELPAANGRRDGSGTPLPAPVLAVGN